MAGLFDGSGNHNPLCPGAYTYLCRPPYSSRGLPGTGYLLATSLPVSRGLEQDQYRSTVAVAVTSIRPSKCDARAESDLRLFSEAVWVSSSTVDCDPRSSVFETRYLYRLGQWRPEDCFCRRLIFEPLKPSARSLTIEGEGRNIDNSAPFGVTGCRNMVIVCSSRCSTGCHRLRLASPHVLMWSSIVTLSPRHLRPHRIVDFLISKAQYLLEAMDWKLYSHLSTPCWANPRDICLSWQF